MGVKVKVMLWSGGILIMLLLGVVSYSQQQTEAKFQRELLLKEKDLTKQIGSAIKEQEKLSSSLPAKQHSEVMMVYQYLEQQANRTEMELTQSTLNDETENISSFLLSLRGDFARLQEFLRIIERNSDLMIQDLKIEAEAGKDKTLVLQIRIAFLR